MSEAIKSNEIKPKSSGTQALFKSPVLEKLSRTHISVPLTIFLSYSTVLLYWSITHTALSTGLTIGFFFFGIFFYTWLEYMLHRYVFHMATYTKTREKLQYVMHGVHHEFPKDKSRLAMPPLLSITLATKPPTWSSRLTPRSQHARYFESPPSATRHSRHARKQAWSTT